MYDGTLGWMSCGVGVRAPGGRLISGMAQVGRRTEWAVVDGQDARSGEVGADEFQVRGTLMTWAESWL